MVSVRKHRRRVYVRTHKRRINGKTIEVERHFRKLEYNQKESLSKTNNNITQINQNKTSISDLRLRNNINKKDIINDKKYIRTKPNVFELPLETAIYVPSTNNISEKISDKEFKSRIEEVRQWVSKMYGGFSSVKITGGFLSDNKNKVITENIVKVVFFSTETAWKKNRNALLIKIKRWRNKWNQESIGLEHEGDLFYIE